ncbi:hypothetical protein [Sporosarcina limicola]|uniref:Uncharacterized protein n=1 Tax=Sporosarcina limicola TaxID=34101 RepID=A0A927MJJ5_9BACL|nr:hypothetical protein [Sporosarcina limicola]MBE1555773.1 hypothetical protein [Sporosarcina limicola]
MYLTEPRLTDIVKKQFLYKLNAYTGVFSSLLIMQLIGLFFGFNTGGGSSGSESLTINWRSLSGDMAVIFTLFWAFSTGILITTLAYRNDAFSFVSTRLSHHVSSFLFLLVMSCIAGITAPLASSVIKLISLFQHNAVFIETSGLFASPVDFFIRIATAVIYTILFAGFGYVIGSLIQLSKLVIPFLVIGLFILPLFNISGTGFIEYMVIFFGFETSLLIFLVKVLITVLVLFAISVAITNKTEVRK